MNFGTIAQLRMGLRHGWNEAELETGFLFPSPPRETDTSVQVRILYDTRDSVALPTRGAFLNARYVESRDWLDGEQDYSLFETVFLRAFRVRREGDSLSLIIGAADTLSGELPLSQDIQLGGIRTFPGLRPGELRGDRYWFAGSTYGWRLFDTQRLFGGGMYAGLRFQAGRMDHGIDATLDGETLLGARRLRLRSHADRPVRLVARLCGQRQLGAPVHPRPPLERRLDAGRAVLIARGQFVRVAAGSLDSRPTASR